MGARIIIDELEFEVPYGKLAAKTWHEETDNCKRILALHGWMDNAGSFDNIMPHIKHQNGLYIVALDLPGHGKSSQLPPGSSYTDINMAMEIRRCLRELGWVQPITDSELNGDGELVEPSIHISNENSKQKFDSDDEARKFTIIGHSLGAGLALFYASLFPDDAEAIILLDFLKSKTTTAEAVLNDVAKSIDQFIEVVPSVSPFSSPLMSKAKASASVSFTNKSIDKGQVIVSQKTAIIATIEAHKQLGDLSEDDARCLLKRSTVAISTPKDSVIYSRDLRLQSMLNLREHWDVNKLMFARVKAHTLSILAKRGLYVENNLFKNNMDLMEDLLRANTKSFNIQWIDADHYLQLNKPKETAEIINNFIRSPADFKVLES